MPTQPDAYLQWVSSRSVSNAVRVEGDSYPAGSGQNNALNVKFRDATGRVVISTAVGGSTLAQERDRILAAPYLLGMTTIIWDGSANGYGSVAAELAIYDQIIAAVGLNKLLVIPSIDFGPSTSSTPSAYSIDRDLTAAGLVLRGVQTLDAKTILANLNNGSAGDLQDVSAGVVPRSLLVDGVHLLSTPMAAVNAALITRVAQLGL